MLENTLSLYTEALTDKDVLPRLVHQMEKPGERHVKNEAIPAVQQDHKNHLLVPSSS